MSLVLCKYLVIYLNNICKYKYRNRGVLMVTGFFVKWLDALLSSPYEKKGEASEEITIL